MSKPKLRVQKKWARRYAEDSGKIVAQYGRTFVVKPNHKFQCIRCYSYIVASTESDSLDALIKEGQMTLEDWNKSNNEKCIRCNAKATYSSPKKYCNEHWAEWWAKGTPPEHFDEVKSEALEVAKAASAQEQISV